jgi:membrane peptidoglycan carboxypeptidase
MTDDRERLRLGRERASGSTKAAHASTYTGDEDDGRLKRIWHRRQERRRRKKERIAAMSRGRRVARRFMVAGTWLLGLIATIMVAAIVMYFAFTDVPRPNDLPLPQVATIEYSDGSTLAKIGTVDRTIVHLEQVPAHVRWAVLAAEDRGFYSEPGVSIRGTVRAALTDLTGGNTQGGSGITQQYVKNAYLNNATSLTRKLKELMIAVKLSREYSKDQILEFYLNTVYFGRGAYGIQAGAQAFFGENVEQLTVAQGALLAGLLRAPSYYDPAVNPGQARARWEYVLDGMVKTNHLTAAQKAAMKFPKTVAPTGTGLGVSGWKYLLKNAVLAELEAHGIKADEVNAKGLTIRTTIDKKAQQAAVSAIKQTFSHLTKQQRNLKNGLVAVQPSSGAVLAYYGGTGPGVKGYDGTINYNDWAQQRANPPGSSFKPYTLATVLTQTLDQDKNHKHYAIDSRVDGSFCSKIEGVRICNDPGDASVSGASVTIKHAMRVSLNTTFDYLASEAGPDNVAATAHAMGVAATDSAGRKTLVDQNGQTSFGIGIGDYPVTVLDQASGFATLANDGVQNPAFLVQKATASDGSVVYEHKKSPKKVLDPKVANDVTLTLEQVAADAGNGLSGGRMSAAKTGTEGVSPKSLNNSDAWMVGYTPQVSAAVWTGTGARKPIFNSDGLPEYGADLPAQAWQTFMDTYLAGKPNEQLATKQLIAADGGVPKPKPTFTPTPSESSSPKPTFTIHTGFPSTSAIPSTTLPPPPTSSSATPTPSPTKTHKCGTLLNPCPSSSSSSPAAP